jgi:hypothetical protein
VTVQRSGNAVLLDLPSRDLAASGAGLAAPRLDELLETLQVAFDSRRHDAYGVADIFDDPFGVIVHRGMILVRLSSSR